MAAILHVVWDVMRTSHMKFGDRWLQTMTLEQMEFSNRVASRESLSASLGRFHLTYINVGHMLGAGIFVLLGTAAGVNAGPSVLLSILLAGVVAGLSALTVCELSSDYPLAGGAFNWVLSIFGEFPAWMTVSVLAVDAMTSGGALARLWSSQLAVLAGTDSWVRSVGSLDLDFVAFGVTFVALIFVAASTLLTSCINIVCKTVLMVIIVILLTAAFPEADTGNWSDFFPHGSAGIFAGAATIYFAYTGFDAASNMAEEAKRPKRYVGFSIIAGLAFVVTVYMLMGSALTLADSSISPTAPFYALFQDLNEDWVANLVTAGALLAVGTVLMVSLMVNCRQFLAMARYNLLPRWLAVVNRTTETPLRITIAFGCTKAVLGLTTSARALTELRSAGALSVTIMVACATLWRRYYRAPVLGKLHDLDEPLLHNSWPGPLFRLMGVLASSQGFGAAYKGGAHYAYLIALGAICLASALSFFALPQVLAPQNYRVPLAPLWCSATVFGASFLFWMLGTHVVWRFCVVLAGCALVYLVYGVHCSHSHAEAITLYRNLLDADLCEEELEAQLKMHSARLDEHDKEWVRRERVRLDDLRNNEAGPRGCPEQPWQGLAAQGAEMAGRQPVP